MKPCAYCGRENLEDATRCCDCGTVEWNMSALKVSLTIKPPYVFPQRELTREQMQMHLTTLVVCRTLAEADTIVSVLAGAGISAVIPDEYLMQAACWNLNTYGFVRVQIAPKDYENAAGLLLGTSLDS